MRLRVCTAIGHVSLLALSASFVSAPGNLVFPHLVQAAHLHNITTLTASIQSCKDIKSNLNSGSGGFENQMLHNIGCRLSTSQFRVRFASTPSPSGLTHQSIHTCLHFLLFALASWQDMQAALLFS